jgi:hypothetical protein
MQARPSSVQPLVVESHQIELDDKFKAKRSLRPQRVEGICDVLVGVQKQAYGLHYLSL